MTPKLLFQNQTTESLLDGTLEWVNIESPSNDKSAVNKMVDLVETQALEVGGKVDRIVSEKDHGDILCVDSPWGSDDDAGILVLMHLDTVHPIGTLEHINPVRFEGDKVYGPGIYDMKAGAYIAFAAFANLVANQMETALPLRFIFVPDEEIGSASVRKKLDLEAKRARFALVTEPARDGGKCVIARKGTLQFWITVYGKAAHAGMRHQDGRNAIVEAAQQVVKISALTDYEKEITVSVGTISGGTALNVVPDRCHFAVDGRCVRIEDAKWLEQSILNLQPFDKDCRIEVTGGLNRPPYQATDGIHALLAHTQALANSLGLNIEGIPTGGGSDANFTAALNVATLDGLGADGAGAHTTEEHIFLSSLLPRYRLFKKLYTTLT